MSEPAGYARLPLEPGPGRSSLGLGSERHSGGRGCLLTVTLGLFVATGFLVAAHVGGSAATATELAASGPLSSGGSCIYNVILVRHCDKVPRWGKHPTPLAVCTERGELRGIRVAQVFGSGGRFPIPDRLFGRRLPPRVYASRDLYLLWPLARRLSLDVNTSFSDTWEGRLGLAKALLDDREACGARGFRERTALVSWNHCSMPALAQALGCQQGRCATCWDDRDFGTVVWIRFEAPSAQGPWKLELRQGREGLGYDLHSTVRGAFDYEECEAQGEIRLRNGSFPCVFPTHG
mmetsp:Transcript_50730/g.110768  ORF Transcript_50730/g.110768 Transcript_50730/m.110768 type:complete len:292 (-) Transcript_50730:15-890(-)